MSKDNFRFNQDGFDRLMAGVQQKMLAIDKGLRTEHTGKPATEIAPHVDKAYRAIGVNLSPKDVQAYADAIERNEDFKIEMGN